MIMFDMPKIVWCGNKKWECKYPEFPLPKTAIKLKYYNDDILFASLPYGIIPFLVCLAIVYVKWYCLETKMINPSLVPIGIILGLIFILVHEWLHAICYCKGQTVYIGISLDKFAAFAVCNERITKHRFIVMSLIPALLGIIPFIIFLVMPSSPIISALCIPMGVIGMLSPMPDYMNVHIVCKQVPKKGFIQSKNDGLYWFK